MRDAIAQLPGSKIREVANAGLGRSDVLAFWFGESDEVTPEAVRRAAAQSLQDGETFYSHNLGLSELRQALAAYTSALHGAVDMERIAVTSSGVNALMLAMQMLAGAGDEVVTVVPLWPNLTAQAAILGAAVRRIALRPRQGRWSLDLDELRAAVTSQTRVLLLNAPNNPTGWTLTRAQQKAILAHCRSTGTWIIADEVYERIHFDSMLAASSVGETGRLAAPSLVETGCVAAPSFIEAGRLAAPSFIEAGRLAAPSFIETGRLAAPSFLDIAGDDDRLVVAHSFSKSFLMTGWRLGWLVLPRDHLDAIGKLIEFNTSCAPVFVQRGALAALDIAPGFVPALVERLRACRDRLITGLARLPGVEVASPSGGMYAFFRIEGENDSLALAKRLVAQHGLGLAPGVAFGAEGEGWLRWCFASRDAQRLDAGVERLASALQL